MRFQRILILLVAVFGFTSVEVLAQASDKSPWQVRLRGIGVVPDESADISVIGGDVHIQNDFVPELDITYFLSEHWALELILATTKHDLTAVDTVLGDVPLGDVHLLPPTLTVQYHLIPNGSIRPYIGAGINYTFFFDADAAGGVVTELDISNSVGFALQIGVDIALDDHWMLNFDVKKLWLDTKARVNGGAIKASVNVDPWIFGAGFGYRF